MTNQTQRERPKIAILDTGYPSFEYERSLFESNGYELCVFPGEKGDVAGKLTFAAEAVGLLIRWTMIDDDVLTRLPGLKAIVRYGTGYDNIDIDAVRRARISVANVPGYARHSVSNHALALMFACARGLPQGQREIRTRFGSAPSAKVFDFHTKTLGIIGLGHIGGMLCTKTTALFKSVYGVDPYIPETRFQELGAISVPLDELLAQSHVISIHCSLTPETQGMIDKHAIDTMRQCPILINTARGPIIEDDALLAALDEGKIHSAGLDVYRSELPEELPAPLVTHPRVIATGHYAWYSEQSHMELQKRAADNLLAMLKGEQCKDSLY